MKYLLHLTFFLLITSSLTAQNEFEFAPDGAKWTYGFFTSAQGVLWDGYETVEYTHDTIIDGIAMKVLDVISYIKVAEGEIVATPGEQFIIYQEGGKVFNNYGGLLYNFEAEIGDTIALNTNNLYGEIWEDVTGIILEKNERIINGLISTDYVVLIDCGWGSAPDTLLYNSQIASFSKLTMNGTYSHSYFYAPYMHCILDFPIGYHLRCYEDDEQGLYQLTEEACDEINIIAANDKVDLGVYFSIAPNPTSTGKFIINLDYELKDAKIQVISSFGQVVVQQEFRVGKNEIFLKEKGVFFVSIVQDGYVLFTRKVISL